MLNWQFLGQNLHFAIGLFAALALFAVSWLYLDAWTGKKNTKNFLRWTGFLLLSLGFLAYAVDVPWIGQTGAGHDSIYHFVSVALRIAGYVFIVIAEFIDPLQEVPTHEKNLFFEDPNNRKKSKAFLPIGLGKVKVLGVATVGFSALAAFMYWRRSTKGLERHLRPMFYGFLILTLFEILAQTYVFRGSSNVILGQFTAVYGPVWLLENAVLLLASILLGRWVWRYLTKRFMSQLFMVFVSFVVLVFLVTTLSFTFLLLRNIQSETLSNLKTTANVLNYALDSKRSETLASSEALSYNPEYISAIIKKDHKKLVDLSSGYLTDKKHSSLIITDDSGQVLLRAEDSDRWGDSVSSDSLIRRALIGRNGSSITTQSGVVAPTLYIKSSFPVRSSNNIIVGTITSAVAVDDAFVDGIKNATGLDASIYAENIRSATTTYVADGKSRWVGLKEQNQDVKHTVLEKGEVYSGTLEILNRPYLAVYSPLKDVDNEVVGMILIGQPQTNLLDVANKSLQKTFQLAVIMLIFSIIPAYFVSKYIVRQL